MVSPVVVNLQTIEITAKKENYLAGTAWFGLGVTIGTGIGALK